LEYPPKADTHGKIIDFSPVTRGATFGCSMRHKYSPFGRIHMEQPQVVLPSGMITDIYYLGSKTETIEKIMDSPISIIRCHHSMIVLYCFIFTTLFERNE
jgi:hypothetical protein